MKSDLPSMRSALDKLDDELVSLLKKRLVAVQEIGRHKAKTGAPVEDKNRETEIAERLRKGADEVQSELIGSVYSAIFESSKKIQRSITAKEKNE